MRVRRESCSIGLHLLVRVWGMMVLVVRLLTLPNPVWQHAVPDVLQYVFLDVEVLLIFVEFVVLLCVYIVHVVAIRLLPLFNRLDFLLLLVNGSLLLLIAMDEALRVPLVADRGFRAETLAILHLNRLNHTSHILVVAFLLQHRIKGPVLA